MVTDRLVIQSIGAGDDWYVPWLALTRPVHERYADRCGADYEFFAGMKDAHAHPAWNRLPMFLDAFARGYRKVVWLDADSLVIDLDADVFAATDDTTPLLMRRTSGFPWPTVTGEQEGWNDGVLVANAGQRATDALRWVWERRRTPLLDHHVPSMWELNWLLDYVFEHPGVVRELHDRWNWMPFEDASPYEGAAIETWHGMPHEERFAKFSATFDRLYGAAA